MKPQIPWEKWRDKAHALFRKYKYALAVLGLGLLLLLWPGETSRSEAPDPTPSPAGSEEDFSVAALEAKLSQTLSQVKGVGEVTVALTVQGGSRRVLAEEERLSTESDGSSQTQRAPVVVSGGSGNGEGPVLIQQLYPRFQGALVVCEGADKASVRLKLMEAISALTGLGADKISICEGKG